jgi:hypothetical protein
MVVDIGGWFFGVQHFMILVARKKKSLRTLGENGRPQMLIDQNTKIVCTANHAQSQRHHRDHLLLRTGMPAPN